MAELARDNGGEWAGSNAELAKALGLDALPTAVRENWAWLEDELLLDPAGRVGLVVRTPPGYMYLALICRDCWCRLRPDSEIPWACWCWWRRVPAPDHVEPVGGWVAFHRSHQKYATLDEFNEGYRPVTDWRKCARCQRERDALIEDARRAAVGLETRADREAAVLERLRTGASYEPQNEARAT